MWCSSLVVPGVTHMGVVRADPFIAVGARHPVLVVRLDAVDVAVLTGTDLQGKYAGRLQAGLP
jgi:hypothetical protein